ncbi:alpha/beta hydrolase [Flexithrix dorotheae]|uniref:alpha/beta hydrolase n=1 Tax=Flexithrix dorotheae TaxID=70993 RepID=UPI00035E9DC1|nr:alpha/beta fold hydrolase [Flexithrix dorotheae]
MKKKILIIITVLFISLNFVAYQHAYHFTHFSDTVRTKTKITSATPFSTKLMVLLNGIENPRPENKEQPVRPFQTIEIASNNKLEAWVMESDKPTGTVILFHGYTGHKSKLLEEAYAFMDMGLNTVMVDFPGSGGSEGNTTAIGYHEAADVLASFQAVEQLFPNQPIYLYGVSMGAAAILRAEAIHQLKPAGIILECPFASLLETTKNRFRIMKVPTFPFSQMLVFWGGTQLGFWGFSHNPADYAKSVEVPTLLMYGLEDDRVSLEATKSIYGNLSGIKKLRTFEGIGHKLYYEQYPVEWMGEIREFIKASTAIQ